MVKIKFLWCLKLNYLKSLHSEINNFLTMVIKCLMHRLTFGLQYWFFEGLNLHPTPSCAKRSDGGVQQLSTRWQVVSGKPQSHSSPCSTILFPQIAPVGT